MTSSFVSGPLADRIASAPVLSSSVQFHGQVWDVATDEVDLGEAGTVSRDYVRHTGAVAVLAVRGLPGHEELVMIQQYRHPVGTYDWEIPAGLLDQAGEDPLAAAQRELAEETDLAADHWSVLIDLFTSPGALSENIRVYLARDIRQAPDTGFVRTGEEHGMPTRWVDVDEAIEAALAGRIHNGPAIAAVMAFDAVRRRSGTDLRASDAPWPAHPNYRDASEQE